LQADELAKKSLSNDTLPAILDTKKLEISPNKSDADARADYNSSAKDYDGGYFGFGPSVGVQKTSATGNREFKNVSESAYSSTFGGIAAIGYQFAAHNFIFGAEIGVDLGSGPKRLRVGGELGENSAGFQYLQRQYLLSQIVNSYFRNLSPYLLPDLAGTSINRNAWSNFLRVNRYLGGAVDAGIVNPDGEPGPIISGFINGAHSQLYVAAGNNPAATYSSFIGQATANGISVLGNGNLALAMKEMRNFIISNNSDLANTLRSIGEANFLYNHAQVANSSVLADLGAIDVDDEAAAQLAGLFSGMGGYTFGDIGVVNTALFNNDETRIDDAIQWSLSGNSSANVNNSCFDNDIKTKSNFGISPYIATKAGYFLNALQSCLYIKAGCIQLTGHISLINNSYTIKNNNFKKIVPFFAIGLCKQIDKHLGISFEFSKTTKANKELPLTTNYRSLIGNKVRINKANLNVIITYTF
jgi:hypothetical protein